MHIPRLIISALRGGGGKTLLSLGLCSAFLQKGMCVKPFKKGPDYIDARWLQLAAQAPCTNLDPFFLDATSLQALFVHAWQHDTYAVSIVEGNRGLFDGQDVHGSCSTAELARVLRAPVILALDVTKMTRTSAALLQGMAHFEKDVHIGGVVLNQVGSSRHESIVRACIEEYTDIPVLGAIPRLKENPLPERHMGLCQEDAAAVHSILENLGQIITEHCDISAISHLAQNVSALESMTEFWPEPQVEIHTKTSVRIGYIYDAAFWFYYAENLEALRRAGAELVPLSLLDSKAWPQDLQALYLGGGYPEEHLPQLVASPHLNTIKAYSNAGMPIYAECGGFMILAQSILRQGQTYAMAGVFPVISEFHSRPQGLGYVQAQVQRENPYHPVGQSLRGHEFHYSKCLYAHEGVKQGKQTLCLSLEKGVGMGKASTELPAMDGLLVHQTFASYTHIYAPACPWWAKNLVHCAAQFNPVTV